MEGGEQVCDNSSVKPTPILLMCFLSKFNRTCVWCLFMRRYPEYVLQHIYHLPMKDPQRSLKAAMLLYASFLINMHNMNSRALEKEGNLM